MKNAELEKRSPGGSAAKIFTEPHETFDQQLRDACVQAVTRSARPNLIVHLNVVIDGSCPAEHRKIVFDAASEMIANAVEHGFYERLQGQVDVWFTSRKVPGIRIDVSDNGWGFDIAKVVEGRGLRLLRSLGEVSLGTHSENTGKPMTTIRLVIPPRPVVPQKSAVGFRPTRDQSADGPCA